MIFSSMVFIWLFLPIIIAAYYICIFWGLTKAANYVLLIASLFFYAWGEPIYILLMLFSIMINWGFGILVYNFKIRSGRILGIGFVIFFDIALLGYYKYAALAVETIDKVFQREYTIPDIALPIGISFFTFQAMSYVIDVYRGECEPEKNLLNLALYISFFPQLIAGPIVKYRDVSLQIGMRTYSREKFTYGVERFILGLSKKVIIANTLAETVDRFYSLDMRYASGLITWCASILYTLQIYYDFSGYSDMAIGLAKMFGFDFKENFNLPYTSHSIREFWRRWHISLGSWFREYVYIPLGGNRKGIARTYFNLIIVFFLTGLWHGASYNFVIWGMFHGIFIVLERVIGEKYKFRISPIVSWLYCFSVVNIGWVLFREENIMKALAYIKRMILPWKYSIGNRYVPQFITPYLVVVIIVAILFAGVIQWYLEDKQRSAVITCKKYHIVYQMVLLLIFMYSMLNLAGDTYNPFIYYRF